MRVKRLAVSHSFFDSGHLSCCVRWSFVALRRGKRKGKVSVCFSRRACAHDGDGGDDGGGVVDRTLVMVMDASFVGSSADHQSKLSGTKGGQVTHQYRRPTSAPFRGRGHWRQQNDVESSAQIRLWSARRYARTKLLRTPAFGRLRPRFLAGN